MNQGKFVLPQIMEFIPKFQFNQCVEKYKGNHRVKSLSCYDQFLAMMFGQLSHQDSLRGVVICLQSQRESLYHLGFSNDIFLPTLAKANEKRNWEIYQELAQILIKQARELYFNDEEFKLNLDGACYVIDASVIDLCLSLFPWAKLKTIRAGVKLNLQMDLKGNLPKFFDIVNAREHDVNFLDRIEIESGAHYIMDRGYLDYQRLYKIHQADAFFVTRLKKNSKFKRIYSNKITKQDKENGIRCDQIIKLTAKLSAKRYPEKLRRINFFDKLNHKYYDFVTNDFNLSAQTIANLYKYRWQTPGQSIAEKAGAARLGIGEFTRVIEIHSPKPIRTLALDDFRRHAAEDCEVTFAVGVMLGQIIQYPRDPSEHPSIAA